MDRRVLIILIAIISTLSLSGCFQTPSQRTAEIIRDREYQQRLEEERQLSYQKNCLEYGYKSKTPQFNQCIAAERGSYTAEQTTAETRRIANHAAWTASSATWAASNAAGTARDAAQASRNACRKAGGIGEICF